MLANGFHLESLLLPYFLTEWKYLYLMEILFRRVAISVFDGDAFSLSGNNWWILPRLGAAGCWLQVAKEVATWSVIWERCLRPVSVQSSPTSRSNASHRCPLASPNYEWQHRYILLAPDSTRVVIVHRVELDNLKRVDIYAKHTTCTNSSQGGNPRVIWLEWGHTSVGG